MKRSRFEREGSPPGHGVPGSVGAGPGGSGEDLGPLAPRVAAGVATAAVAIPAVHYLRGLPWSYAVMSGLAFGALAFLVVRAVQNLSNWKPRE